MRKITLDNATAGMVVAADIFGQDFDGDLPLICRGVELSDPIISKLRGRGFIELIIVTPPDYRGAPGEILAPTEVTGNILFDGAVELNCDLPPETKIEAGEDIIINGTVGPGCNVRSANGDVVITGTLAGAVDKHIVICAAKRVAITSTTQLCGLDIRALGEVAISGDISDSTVAAKGRLRIDGSVVRSKIYSQARIMVENCGNNTDPCHLLVKPLECGPLFQKLLGFDKQNTAFEQERQRLQNTIELVKKLGKDIERMPYENKVEIATDIKRFQEVSEEIKAGQERKEQIKKEIAEALATSRIIIRREALAKTWITIENCSLILDEPVTKTAFFVRNMRVEAAPFG
ncbi:MAG: FapA family protein [Desulfobulbaceae bacterium]|nr:FapA family protein [Desulfobulbaceae bacterium]HIJ90885.1 DUF342 domain-containing protein [Deltaproteobacteria bacterium]